MEVQVSKENICINKLVAEKKELFFVHSDMIVPDSKPDILNAINVTGNVCVYKKEIMEDKVKISGNVNTHIMYLPDSKEDNLRALNCNLEFTQNIDVPGCKEGMMIVTSYCIRDIECKVINGRKISVKAGIEASIKVYSNEDIEIINKINNIENIQTLEQNFLLNSLVGSGKTTVYAKDTLNIDNQDEIAEILKVDINLVDKDIKISYNKILAKAELEVKIMYLTEDNRIERIVGKIPVVGFIDIQNISENNICDINYQVKNMLFRPNPADEHSIYVEVEIEQFCMAFEKKEINLIQDLYSPTCNLEFSQKRISSNTGKFERTKEFTVKENIQIPDLAKENLIDVDTKCNINNVAISDSKITYVGNMDINFIFINDGRVNSRNSKIPFEFSVDNVDKTEKLNVETEIMLQNTNFNIQNQGEVESEITVQILSKTSVNVNINIIENIENGEDNNQTDNYDSLILYIVRDGDTLWKIAKRFNSTVEELVKMNGIEDENNISIGQKIYIPKLNSYQYKMNNFRGNEIDDEKSKEQVPM